jgi:hypothetical protein
VSSVHRRRGIKGVFRKELIPDEFEIKRLLITPSL